MYRIYKINVEYSRRDYSGRNYAPDFMDVLNVQTALYPEIIAETDDTKKIVEEWEKAKKEYKYIEKLDSCLCWRGSYIELDSDEIELDSNEEVSLLEPSYGDENFYIRDIQAPSYKESDLEWLR